MLWWSSGGSPHRIMRIKHFLSVTLPPWCFLSQAFLAVVPKWKCQWSTDLAAPQAPFVELGPVNDTFQCCSEWTSLLLCAIYNLLGHALTNIFCDLITAITESLNDFSCWICSLLSSTLLLGWLTGVTAWLPKSRVVAIFLHQGEVIEPGRAS